MIDKPISDANAFGCISNGVFHSVVVCQGIADSNTEGYLAF